MAKIVRTHLYQDHDPYLGFDTGPMDMQGWASEIYRYKDHLDNLKPKVIIEVGTWKGSSAINIAKYLKTIQDHDFEIICVDTFDGSSEHWTRQSFRMTFEYGRPTIYKTFLTNVIINDCQDVITPFPVDSTNGFVTLKHFGVLADFIYIDAGHDYQSVRTDLLNYQQLLRNGGVLVGDDFNHDDVKAAAIDTFKDKVFPCYDKFYWIK